MAITFTGGQSMPAFGTQAYSALSTAQNTGTSGAGSFNPTTGVVSVNSTPIYTPPTGGGSTATTPVVTANNAQTDYIQKFNTFDTLSKQIAAQGAAKASQDLINQQKSAQEQLEASRRNLEQQKIDIQATQALAQQQQAQASREAAKAIGEPETAPAPVPSPITAPTPAPAPSPAPTVTTGATGGTQVTTPAEQQKTALTTEQAELAKIQTQKDTVASQSIDLLKSVINGTIPLTGPQQALITSLQTQLSQNKALQTQANEAYTGQVTQAAFRSGGEYTPQQMAGQIQNAVSVGVARIQQLDNSAAQTIANLEVSFQKQNYDVINKQYDILTKQLDDKAAAIKDTYNETTKLIQDQRDFEQRIEAAKTDAQKNYEQYRKDTLAKGLTPLDMNTYTTEQAYKTEFAKAKGAAAGKIAGESTGIPAVDTVIEADPNSRSIMSQTGLSAGAYAYATLGSAGLTRMNAADRTKYMNEWRQYQISHNIDGATFKAQYEAYNKTVGANILRNNQAAVAADELVGTIANIKSAAEDAGLSDLKALNIAKIFKGDQLNTPETETFKIHLTQLRNELSMYNAATAGQLDSNGNIRENSKAEMDDIANNIIQNGFSQGSIEGFEKAIKASQEKLGVVLDKSIEAQNKQVWKIFGVGDKYQAPPVSSEVAQKKVETYISSSQAKNPIDSSLNEKISTMTNGQTFKTAGELAIYMSKLPGADYNSVYNVLKSLNLIQ